MAIIKNPMVRYQVIHACLSDKRKKHWTLEELMEKIRDRDIPVKTRTIMQDIERMRVDEILGYFAPIVYSKKYKGYYYSDPDFTIASLPLTTDDMEAIRAGTTLLEKYRGSKMLEGLEGVLKKAANFLKHTAAPVQVSEPSPVYSSTAHHLEALKHAIYEKQALLLTFTDSREKITFHPYFLKEVNLKWYVAGLPEGAPACRAFALGNIAQIEQASTGYRENTLIDRETYFLYNYGAQPVRGEVMEVELWCSHDIAFLITASPFHPGQQMIGETGDGIIISVKLIPDHEFIRDLFIYGNSIDVKNPPQFRAHWRDAIRRADEDEQFLTG